MAKASFDIKDIAQFDFRAEAQRSLHAGVGAADLAIETIKEYVADVQKVIEGVQKDAQKAFTSAQKSVKDFEFEPKALRSQATTVLNARVGELSKDAKTRRTAIEKRVSELQADAQKFVTGNVVTATGTYTELAKRGETVVKRLRKETAKAADPAPATTTTAKKAPAKKTAKKAPAKKATSSK
jgi:hypothetical protein